MIGAFYQPNLVIADIAYFQSLPARQVAAGIAEIIKYGFIYDADFFAWLEQNISALMAKDPQALSYAVFRSCQIKAEVVAKDEKEMGIRAWLNFGHTFGHAIETHQGYGTWLHGEAVAIGMMMAVDLSCRLGWIDELLLQRAKNLLLAAQLPIFAPEDMTIDDFLNLMSVDKKVLDGNIRLVLLKSLGEATVTADFDRGALEETLSMGKQLAQL